MKPTTSWRWALSALALTAGSASAQWMERSIDLQPGWNAIFLDVNPADPDPSAVFAGVPVESVWSFNRRSTAVRYAVSPTQLIPEDPDWLAWFAPPAPEAAVSDLFSIAGGQGYLVKLGGAAPATMTVIGTPSLRRPRFLADSLSFVGFSIEGTGPTFANFFSASAAHAGQAAYRLQPDGTWTALNPATDRLRAGEAFWIATGGASRFEGPYRVEPPSTSGIDFAARTVTIPLRLENPGTAAKTLTLSLLDSEAPPSGITEEYAGPVPLTRYVFDLPNQTFGQIPVSTPFTVTIPPKRDVTLTLGVDRAAMLPYTPTAGAAASYQSILRIDDGSGSVRHLPVRAKGSGEGGGQRASAVRGGSIVDLRPGLWVGAVTVDAVSQPANANLSGSTDPLPVGAKFQFRILMHVDGDGDATLLQQVFLMFKPAITAPDPQDPEAQIVVEPARFVLVTDESLLPNFEGGILRDGKDIGRRVSSTAFTFRTPQPMTTDDSGGARTYRVNLSTGFDDPLNPFKHKYHPDHDNKNELFTTTLPEGAESYTVTRAVALELSPTDLNELVQAGYGDTVITGFYRETIGGVHRDPINVSGIFRMQNISNVEELNDGL